MSMLYRPTLDFKNITEVQNTNIHQMPPDVNLIKFNVNLNDTNKTILTWIVILEVYVHFLLQTVEGPAEKATRRQY